MRNIELNKVRNKIDKLDKKLLVLIKKRTDLVKKVIKLKKFKKQIVDKIFKHRSCGNRNRQFQFIDNLCHFTYVIDEKYML